MNESTEDPRLSGQRTRDTSIEKPARRSGLLGFLARQAPMLYILPGLILYGLFYFYPLVWTPYLSLFRWDGITAKRFVGLRNYVELFTDDRYFFDTVLHNVQWVILGMIVPVAIGMGLALLLGRTRLRARTVFRTIYFLPMVLSSVVVAIIWRWVYSPDYGALNSTLRAVGLPGLAHGWLGDKHTALLALFIAWTWITYAFCMIIFIAALQGLDETYFDAAKVDGANRLQQFWYVLIPLMSRSITTVMLLLAIASLQVFDLVWIMTKGGPGTSTLVLGVYMYQRAFAYSRVGYGTTIATMLGILILIFSVVFLRIRRASEVEL